MHTPRVTRYAIATSGRNAWLQVRNGCMAERAITTMGDINCRIRSTTRVMTAGACCPEVVLNATDSHITGDNMISVCHSFI